MDTFVQLKVWNESLASIGWKWHHYKLPGLFQMSDRSAPVMFSTIEDLQSASIQYVSYENNKSWNVHINRTNGKPQV